MERIFANPYLKLNNRIPNVRDYKPNCNFVDGLIMLYFAYNIKLNPMIIISNFKSINNNVIKLWNLQ